MCVCVCKKRTIAFFLVLHFKLNRYHFIFKIIVNNNKFAFVYLQYRVRADGGFVGVPSPPVRVVHEEHQGFEQFPAEKVSAFKYT